MKRLTSQKITFVAVGFAAIMVFCPTLLAPCAASLYTSQSVSVGSVGDQYSILFKRGTLDTRANANSDILREDQQATTAMRAASSKLTRIVQFGGAIRPRWINALEAVGAQIVGYIPHNAYIIRGTADQLARVSLLYGGADWDSARPIRWMGRLLAVQKLDPTYTDEMLSTGFRGELDAEIELIDSADSSTAIDEISRAASSVSIERRKFLNFLVLSVTVRADRLLDIAS